MAFAVLDPTVGSSRTFINFKGELHSQAEVVREITREGVDGVSFIRIGKKAVGSPFVATLDAVNAAGAHVIHQALRDMKGQLATFTDVRGIVHNNVMIQESTHIETVRIGLSVGGTLSNPQYLIRWRFVLRATAV